MKSPMSCYGSGARAVLLAGVCGLAMAGPSYTQTASASTTVKKNTVTTEVVVTARRRAEPISKTPMAITAITGQQLIEQGVVTANQLQYVAPSLAVTQGRQGVQLTLRGVATTDTSTKGEPDIAFNIDGVPNLRSEEQGLAIFDVQRVEVLNGPQSTLYGVASTGGDLNLITNAPTWTQAASGTFEVGNYNTRRVQVMLNEPINDWLAFRAAISDNQRNGYLRLIGGNSGDNPGAEDNFSRRVSLLARFRDDFTIRLTETGGTLGGPPEIDGVALTTSSATVGTNADYIAHANPVGIANQFQGGVNDHWDSPTLAIDGAVGPVHLSLLSNYNYYHEDTTTPSYTPDNQGGRIWIRERYQTYFNEFRASNENPDDRFQYIAGVNYLWQQNNENGHGWDVDDTAPAPLDPDFVTTDEPINTTTQTSFSGFIHTITKITDKLRFTAGVRGSFDRDDRVGTFAITAGLPPGGPYALLWPNQYGTPCVGTQNCYGLPDSAGQHTKAVTWNLGLDYQITPTQMVYVSDARGYKPGGFNDPNPSLPGGGTADYGPERLNAYEVGYKLSTPTGLRFSTNFFYYDYGAEQINEGVQINPTTTIFYTLLKPTTEYGSESSLTIPITPDDQATLTADFLHGTYAKGNGAITGWSLANMPAAVLGASYTHTWEMADGGMVKLHANTRWSARYIEDDLTNYDQFIQQSYTRSDADLSYITPNGKFTTQGFVTNIENKVQFTQAGLNTTYGYVSGQISTPRFWGLREMVKF